MSATTEENNSAALALAAVGSGEVELGDALGRFELNMLREPGGRRSGFGSGDNGVEGKGDWDEAMAV